MNLHIIPSQPFQKKSYSFQNVKKSCALKYRIWLSLKLINELFIEEYSHHSATLVDRLR